MSFIDIAGSVLSKGLELSLSASKPAFRDILHSRFKEIFLRSVIKLVLIFGAVLLVIFNTFGQWWSELFASALFLGVLGWSLFGMLLLIRNNFLLFACILRERDLNSGIITFVKECWLGARIGISLFDIFRGGRGDFCRHFNQLPSSDEVVGDFISYVIKDIVLFIVLLALYFLVMRVFLVPLLLKTFTDLSIWELYAFPVVQIVQTINKI